MEVKEKQAQSTFKLDIVVGEIYLAVLTTINNVHKISPVLVEGIHKDGGYIVRNLISQKVNRIKHLWRFKKLFNNYLSSQ